ncbi:hypothetical protein IWX92DRAFT_361754 [Phyllosticta citricarpa]
MFFAQHSPSGPSNYMHARRLCRGSPLPRFLAQHLDYTPVRMYMQRPRHCQTEGNTVVAKSLVRETSLFAGLFGSPPMMPTPPPPSPHLALGSDLTLSLVGRLSLRKERSVSRSAACSQECQEQYGLRRLQLPFLSFIFISFFLYARALPIYIPTVHMHGNGLRRAQPTSTPVRLRAKWPTTTECLVILEGEGRVRNCRLADCLLACLPACPAPRALFRSRRMRACIERKKATS